MSTSGISIPMLIAIVAMATRKLPSFSLILRCTLFLSSSCVATLYISTSLFQDQGVPSKTSSPSLSWSWDKMLKRYCGLFRNAKSSLSLTYLGGTSSSLRRRTLEKCSRGDAISRSAHTDDPRNFPGWSLPSL